MASNWNYTVIHTDIDTDVTTDLSDDVIGIPIFTDTGTGELNVAHLQLSAANGKYVTSSPKIDQFDKIRIVCIDGTGYTYDLVYDVKNILPPENKREGTIVELDLVDPAQHLNRMYYVGPRYFENSYEMFKQIGRYYNENSGLQQPILKGHDLVTYNKLPNYTMNTYDFGLNQEKCLNRMLQVVDKLGGSVESGGVLDYYDIKFESAPGNITDLYVKAFPSGSTGSFIIRSDSVDDIISTEPELNDMDGNVVYAWGGDTDGSLPVDFSKYKSAQQLFPLHPIWRNDVPYKIGATVQRLGIHYKRGPPDVTLPASNPTLDTNWDEITTATEYGDVIDYSPWTRYKQPEWKSSFAHTGGHLNELFGQSAWDGNVVVFDEDTAQRTWVDVLIPNGGGFEYISDLCLFGGALPYRGLRVLLIGTGTGAFAGDDVFGNSKNKQVLEYGDISDPLGAQGWFVKFPTLLADPNAMVSIIQKGSSVTAGVNYAGRVFKYLGGVWTDIGSEINGNDCFHPYWSLTNSDGVPNNSFGTVGTDKNFKSAITASYIYNPISAILGGAGLSDNPDHYYKCGAWLNLRFPFPISTIPAGSTGEVGYLFGGDSGGNDLNMEPVTLDVENMNYLTDGTRGFNQPLSESYGQLSDVAFFMKTQYEGTVDGEFVNLAEANFKVRCFLFDTDDNVLSQDFVVAFNNKWEEFHLPFSGFQIYRGRRPREWFDQFIPTKQQDAQNIFIWRNLKQICFQLQESYDSDGRYAPQFSRYISPSISYDTGGNTTKVEGLIMAIETALLGLAGELLVRLLDLGGDALQASILDRRLSLSIDGLRFTKPLLVGSGNVTDREIEVDFLERRTIGNYYQLQGDVLAELEKSQHRKTIYTIHTPGEFTIKHGDTFYYINPRIVNFSDSGANTVKLVSKKIEYSITKSGGFIRTITGVRRFV